MKGFAVALFGKSPDAANELAFQPGNRIAILYDSCPNWWIGELRGRRGTIPANFVTKI